MVFNILNNLTKVLNLLFPIMKLQLSTLLFFIPFLVCSQNIKFWAKADAKQVALGNYFELSYIVQNASLQDVEIPDFKDFIKKTDPVSSVNYQNNVKTEQISITLQAKKIGTFIIPPTKIKVNGVFQLTNPVSIEVVNQKLKNKGTTLFLEMSVENKVNYIGAPITLTIKSYSTIPIQSFSELNFPNLEHFISQEQSNFDDSPIKEIINGVAYETRVIKKFYLYPQKTGTLIINPLSINAFVKENEIDLKSIGLQSNELTLSIKKIPDNAPKEFNGAIGHYVMLCDFGKENTSRLKITIKGIGDIKRIHPPSIVHSDSIYILAPSLIQEKIENDTAQKVYEFILMAKQTCHSKVNVLFSYFDTEKNQYEVLKQEISLSLKATSQNMEQTDAQSNKNNANSNVSQNLLYLILIIPLLALIFYFYKKKPQIQEKISSEIIARTETELTIPIMSIAEVEYELQKGSVSLFYKRASLLLQNQLIKHYNLPKNSSRFSLLKALSQSDRKNLTEPIISFLNRCDAARFGGALETLDAKNDLVLLKDLLEKIS